MIFSCPLSCFVSALVRFVASLRALSGFKRYGVAFLLGVLAALAFPPLDAFPVLWISFPALYILLQSAHNKKQAFAVGWSFAFGLLAVSLHWISGSLFVDIQKFWWALPFALAGLPALFSFYYGLAALGAWIWGLHRREGPLVLALLWFAAEWARGHLFTGFPWDMLGYIWGDYLSVLQSVSVIGIEGLTLVTLALCLTPAFLLFTHSRRQAAYVLVPCVGVLCLLALGGLIRLQDRREAFVPDVRLRLVQPHHDQSMKWKAEAKQRNFEQLLALSFDAPSDKPITHIIWPETASTYYLAEEPLLRSQIAARMNKDSVLITGVVRRQAQEDGQLHFYNSLIALNDHGDVVAGYDKYHLVPFGEFMPLRSVISVGAIASGSDFTAGEGVRTVRAPHLPPFGALVCYEVIFSGDVAEREDRPAFLLNVTNDAWYDHTMGPEQHFAIARVRAIEEGLPLVRVANKGRTGVIDSYGIGDATHRDEGAVFVDADLSVPLVRPTFFATHPHAGSALIALFLVILAFFVRFRMKD